LHAVSHNTSFAESGRLEFEEFVTLAAKFIVEDDAEALEKELREAFRLYDKEGNNKSRNKVCKTKLFHIPRRFRKFYKIIWIYKK